MKRYQLHTFIAAILLLACPAIAFSLGEEQITVSYKVIHTTGAGELTSYAHYGIVGYEDDAYWLQRVISMTLDSKPLSITQTLLDSKTHHALRYIMHRPAKMDRPPSVIDLPLDRMGKDEILPFPLEALSGVRENIQTEIGEFDALRISEDDTVLWLSADIPVLGVAKTANAEFTMELIHVRDTTDDLLAKKPPRGGVVYLENE
jgi:hypothetical protein